MGIASEPRRRSDAPLAGVGVVMVLCCAVAPWVIGAVAGSAIGGWLGIACAVEGEGARVHAKQPQPEGSSESPDAHARKTAPSSSEASRAEPHAELRPLGIDIEAWPFVALATLASLSLAFAAWLRARLAPLLALVAVMMLAFAALDVGEVLHQIDINEDALAALAAGIALLHGGAALVAAVMASRTQGPDAGSPEAPGTMAA